MLAIPVKDHEDVRSILSSMSEAGPHRGAVPPVHGVSNNLSPCQGRGVRRIVCRAIVNDHNLTRELSRSQDDRADGSRFIVRGNRGKNPRFYSSPS